MAILTQASLERDRTEPCEDCSLPPEEHEIVIACRGHMEATFGLLEVTYKPGGILSLACPVDGCIIAEIAVAP
jgi:hypothetical protein